MRCRTMVKENGVNNIVWFGSYGRDENGNAKKAYIVEEGEVQGKKQAESNFSAGLQAIADDLTQKLSVMKGELWHKISFGLPLLDKVKSKALIDSAVAEIVMKQDNVTGIAKFSSTIYQKEYHAEIQVQTNFGEISVSI